MDEMPAELWIAACAHRMQQQWRSIDPAQLDEVAGDLLRDERLRSKAPTEAAVEWLRPVAAYQQKPQQAVSGPSRPFH